MLKYYKRTGNKKSLNAIDEIINASTIRDFLYREINEEKYVGNGRSVFAAKPQVRISYDKREGLFVGQFLTEISAAGAKEEVVTQQVMSDKISTTLRSLTKDPKEVKGFIGLLKQQINTIKNGYAINVTGFKVNNEEYYHIPGKQGGKSSVFIISANELEDPNKLTDTSFKE